MKWNLLKGMQTVAAGLACFTLLITPVAQGAKASETKKAELRRFLKMAGFDDPKKTLTVGEYYRKFRHWYPEPVRAQLDEWVALNRHEMMPKVDVNIIKDKNGEEQIRMFFTKDGQSFTLTSGEDYAQIGSVRMTAEDYYNPQAFIEKLSTEDKYVKNIVRKQKPRTLRDASIALSKKELASFSKGQRAQYFLRLRALVDNADRILNGNANQPKKSKATRKTASVMSPAVELMTRWTLGEPAYCQQIPAPGAPCIVAGWVSVYDERGASCGGQTAGRAQWENQISLQFSNVFPKAKRCGGGFPCNPLVYGFTSSGETYCVSQEEVKYATRTCNERSPLNSQNDAVNAQRIVQSWLQAQGNDIQLEFNEKGELRADQYAHIEPQLNALNSYIDEAMAYCDGQEGQKLQEKREDQQSACDEIRKRKLALQKFIITPSEGDDSTRCATIPGACYDPASKACTCEDGSPMTRLSDGSMGCLIGPVNQPKEKKKTNWWPWIIGGALVAGLATCLLWWCKKDKKTVATPPPTTPVDDCDINPSLPKCQPVDPCVANPTSPLCQPPAPPPPPPPPPAPPTPTSEGGSGTPGANSGGVR